MIPGHAPLRSSAMFDHLILFLLHWAITALSLWVASRVFRGISFADTSSLVISALLLGFANAIVKPLLIVLTLPLTLLTFGLFLLVINALMILLVSALVRGFKVSGFWTAFFASDLHRRVELGDRRLRAGGQRARCHPDADARQRCVALSPADTGSTKKSDQSPSSPVRPVARSYIFNSKTRR